MSATIHKSELYHLRCLLDTVRKNLVNEIDGEIDSKYTTQEGYPDGLYNPNTKKDKIEKAINKDIQQINELLSIIHDDESDLRYVPDEDATVTRAKT